MTNDHAPAGSSWRRFLEQVIYALAQVHYGANPACWLFVGDSPERPLRQAEFAGLTAASDACGREVQRA